MNALDTVRHETDLCVVGGGMAGICAAVAAARHGTRVTLVHDRPVLGGNASPEIRMWICGAFGANMRETGIIEEIELENIYRNPHKNYSQWAALLHDFVTREPNISLVLNASVLDATVEPEPHAANAGSEESTASATRIKSVRAWQLTTQRFHEVTAHLFLDSSGDSILAPLTGAEVRWGRESRDEFDESHAVDEADGKTMGMSCLVQVRETEEAREFVPPDFAHFIERENIGPGRSLDFHRTNFWWLEAGGEKNTIRDTEEIRDDVLAIATGVWDFIKRNDEEFESRNWTLDWLGFLPGKRESRRYVGDHIITQNDVEAGGPFEDVIAYGGWSMDDHAPLAFYDPGEPTVFHPAPSPWGIPYRALYSRDIVNLFCAGRNISATHIALSSSRVMRTCAIIGQAVGTAAAIAIRHGSTPRGVYQAHLEELQQTLLRDDSYLPGVARLVPDPSRSAELSSSNQSRQYSVCRARTRHPDDAQVFASGLKEGQRTSIEWYETTDRADPEVLRDGVDRTVGLEDHGFWCEPGDSIEYRFAHPVSLTEARIVFDSNLSRHYKDHRMKYHYPLNDPGTPVAETLVREYRLELEVGGEWQEAATEDENRQRLLRISMPAAEATAVRLIPTRTWGSSLVHIFAFDIA